jgi:two-component system, chemotaxis family, chemotaxis protein CheY
VKPRLSGINVLVIDDDPVTRRLYALWLDQLGAGVREAKDGFEGLELIWAERPDVVLCDLAMPNFDGYAFVAGLREDFKLQTPVIAITGRTAQEALVKSIEAGFASFLAKPVTIDQVAAQITRVLGR